MQEVELPLKRSNKTLSFMADFMGESSLETDKLVQNKYLALSKDCLDLQVVLNHLRDMEEISISSRPGEDNCSPEISTKTNSILKNSQFSYPLDYVVFNEQMNCLHPFTKSLIRYLDWSIMNVAEGSSWLSCFPHRVFANNSDNELGSFRFNKGRNEIYFFKKNKHVFTLKGEPTVNRNNFGGLIPFKELWSCFSKQNIPTITSGPLYIDHLSGECDNIGKVLSNDYQTGDIESGQNKLIYNITFPKWMSCEDKLLLIAGVMYRTSHN